MSSREIMNAKGFAVMDNDERVFRDPVAVYWRKCCERRR